MNPRFPYTEVRHTLLGMDLGGRIRRAREDAGMTQADLAFALRAFPGLTKLGPSRVSDWERDKYAITFIAVNAIAQVTGKPLDFFSATLDELLAAAPPSLPHPDDVRDDTAAVLESRDRRQQGKAGRSRRRKPD